MIKKYTIYGERCCGTKYLQELITKNFNTPITWEYGWKHFFGFQDKLLKKSEGVLFICITRNIYDWLNSFFRKKWHIANHLRNSEEKFLNDEFYSHNYFENRYEHQKDYVKGITKTNSEILEDRNINTKERYKNIFELRHIKMDFLINKLPKKVDNYILIKYEDLIINFDKTMNLLKNKGLEVKNNIEFPLNIKKKVEKRKRRKIIFNLLKYIKNNEYFNLEIENKIGYDLIGKRIKRFFNFGKNILNKTKNNLNFLNK